MSSTKARLQLSPLSWSWAEVAGFTCFGSVISLMSPAGGDVHAQAGPISRLGLTCPEPFPFFPTSYPFLQVLLLEVFPTNLPPRDFSFSGHLLAFSISLSGQGLCIVSCPSPVHQSRISGTELLRLPSGLAQGQASEQSSRSFC